MQRKTGLVLHYTSQAALGVCAVQSSSCLSLFLGDTLYCSMLLHAVRCTKENCALLWSHCNFQSHQQLLDESMHAANLNLSSAIIVIVKWYGRLHVGKGAHMALLLKCVLGYNSVSYIITHKNISTTMQNDNKDGHQEKRCQVPTPWDLNACLVVCTRESLASSDSIHITHPPAYIIYMFTYLHVYSHSHMITMSNTVCYETHYTVFVRH